jgi:hypothetical protein
MCLPCLCTCLGEEKEGEGEGGRRRGRRGGGGGTGKGEEEEEEEGGGRGGGGMRRGGGEVLPTSAIEKAVLSSSACPSSASLAATETSPSPRRHARSMSSRLTDHWRSVPTRLPKTTIAWPRVSHSACEMK